MLIAHLSDPHIQRSGELAYGRVDTAQGLAGAVEDLLGRGLEPDVVVLGGDLVHSGHPDEYRRLRAILGPIRRPMIAVVGNHDSRAPFLDAFGDQPWAAGCSGFVQYSVEDGPVRLIALDTVIPGRTEGELCDARLDWLEARLAEQPDRTTILVMHHPPFATGIGPMDALNLVRGAERLASLVGAHARIERILCGHVHRSVQTRWAGTLACIAPSTGLAIHLDLRSEAPLAFRVEPPGYWLHAWLPGSGLVSHAIPIGNYPGPYRFSDGSRIE